MVKEIKAMKKNEVFFFLIYRMESKRVSSQVKTTWCGQSKANEPLLFFPFRRKTEKTRMRFELGAVNKRKLQVNGSLGLVFCVFIAHLTCEGGCYTSSNLRKKIKPVCCFLLLLFKIFGYNKTYGNYFSCG
jgi:hypothetical protein